MKHVLYSEEYIYYLQLKRYKCLSKLGRVLMLWSKGILPPTDIHELLRCYATFAILKTFGFADFPWKSLHPHVFAGPKLKNLIVQAGTAFGAFDPDIILSHYKTAGIILQDLSLKCQAWKLQFTERPFAKPHVPCAVANCKQVCMQLCFAH